MKPGRGVGREVAGLNGNASREPARLALQLRTYILQARARHARRRIDELVNDQMTRGRGYALASGQKFDAPVTRGERVEMNRNADENLAGRGDKGADMRRNQLGHGDIDAA